MNEPRFPFLGTMEYVYYSPLPLIIATKNLTKYVKQLCRFHVKVLKKQVDSEGESSEEAAI